VSEPEDTLSNIVELMNAGALTHSEAIRRAFDYGKICGRIEAICAQLAELDKGPA